MGPAAVCVPGMFRIPAALVGEVALDWLVSRTQPIRATFSNVGEICQVSCAVGTMARCGVVSAEAGLPFRIEMSPDTTESLRQYVKLVFSVSFSLNTWSRRMTPKSV